MSFTGCNRGDRPRSANDAYETPQWCIDLLVDRLVDLPIVSQCRHIIDAGAGDGRIGNSLLKRILSIRPGSPKPRLHLVEYAEGRGDDFLTWGSLERLGRSIVVSNPPFSQARAFIERALFLEPLVAAFLLRLNFLGTRRRVDFWRRNPVRRLTVLVPRPSFVYGGTDACEYAWFWWGDALTFETPEYPGLSLIEVATK